MAWGTPCAPSSPELLPCCPHLHQVTQPGTGEVLALAGPEPGELAAPELELLSRSLMGTLLRLARERDLGAQVGVQHPLTRWRNGLRLTGRGGLGSRCVLGGRKGDSGAQRAAK